mgnify:CR=1 FL=1
MSESVRKRKSNRICPHSVILFFLFFFFPLPSFLPSFFLSCRLELLKAIDLLSMNSTLAGAAEAGTLPEGSTTRLRVGPLCLTSLTAMASGCPGRSALPLIDMTTSPTCSPADAAAPPGCVRVLCGCRTKNDEDDEERNEKGRRK